MNQALTSRRDPFLKLISAVWMELDPDLNIINIILYTDNLQENEKRGDFSPRSISAGVGRGT